MKKRQKKISLRRRKNSAYRKKNRKDSKKGTFSAEKNEKEAPADETASADMDNRENQPTAKTGGDNSTSDNHLKQDEEKTEKHYDDLLDRILTEKRTSFSGFMDSLKKKDEENEKRQRERIKAATAGDIIGAIANLYATTQGAPDASTDKSMAHKLRERFDKINNEKRKADSNTLRLYLSGIQGEEKMALNKAILQLRKEEAERKAILNNEKIKAMKATNNINETYASRMNEAKLQKMKADAEKARTDADRRSDIIDENIRLTKARRGQAESSTLLNNKRAASGYHDRQRSRKMFSFNHEGTQMEVDLNKLSDAEISRIYWNLEDENGRSMKGNADGSFMNRTDQEQAIGRYIENSPNARKMLIK